jgi:hypothetical protein
MKIKLSICVLFTALLMVFGNASVCFGQEDDEVGGYVGASVSDSNVVAAARFAVKERADKQGATINLLSINADCGRHKFRSLYAGKFQKRRRRSRRAICQSRRLSKSEKRIFIEQLVGTRLRRKIIVMEKNHLNVATKRPKFGEIFEHYEKNHLLAFCFSSFD